jgi:hypothetical protein
MKAPFKIAKRKRQASPKMSFAAICFPVTLKLFDRSVGRSGILDPDQLQCPAMGPEPK